MTTHTIVGYADWASFLVNGDPSGLDDESFAECQAWLASHKHYDYDVLSVEGEQFFAYPDGGDFLKGMCVRYVFVERE